MRWTRVGLVALLAGLSVAGCTDSDDSPENENEVSEIEVLDPGQDPHELSYDLNDGDTFDVTMHFDQTLEISVDGAPQPVPEVPLELQTTFEVREASDEGYEVEQVIEEATLVDDAGIEPQIREQIEQALADTEGLRSTFQLTRHGFVEDSETDVPDSAAPIIGQTVGSLEATSIPLFVALPTDAIGEGARWRVQSEVSVAGIDAEAAVEYELTELRGDDLVVSFDVELSAASGDVGGLQIDDLAGQVTGTAEVNTGELIPTVYDAQADVQTEMSGQIAGQDLELSTSVSQQIGFER